MSILPGTAPKLSQHNGRVSYPSRTIGNTIGGSRGSQIVDQNRSVKNHEPIHGITISFIVIREGKLARIFLHQVFERLIANDLAQSDMDCLSPGFDPESVCCFIGKFRVQSD